ncbi:MAG: DNA repair and recombination protein RadA [Halobacteria archaeon]|nr:DNA repair and recombination protein RadA [Halobacteria archaeon]
MSTTQEELEDLPGVGSATADKLAEAGYNTVKSIAVASPNELSEASGIGDSTAAKIIRAAREEADIGGFETGSQLFERRKEIGKLKTLVPEIDELLGGGMETQSITELYGEFGSGKSQFTHQLAVNVQLPKEEGGLDGSAIFIDSEDTFRPERIAQMVRGLDNDVLEVLLDEEEIGGSVEDDEALDQLIESVLDNIHVAKAFNSDHQILLAEKAREIAEDLSDTDKPLRLVIVDSLTAHFRAEYVGRGNLAPRQQKLNKHMHDILRIANLNNAVAVVTNQVQSNPDAFFGDPTKPVGGNILGHTSTFRIYIRKSKKDKRIVKLVDAPNLPDGEAVLRIKEEGLKPE